MTITLPTLPRNTRYTLRPIRGSNVLRPAFGGPRQPFNRMGDHWAIEVDTGALDQECGLALLADLSLAGGEAVLLPVPGLPVMAEPGTPRVKGAGQAGSTLLVDGMTNGVTIKKGRPFSVIINGQRYLYMVTAAITVSGGEAALPIWPMLRVSPTDNAVVEIANPKIEGFVDAGTGWETGLIKAVVPEKFTIEEVE